MSVFRDAGPRPNAYSSQIADEACKAAPAQGRGEVSRIDRKKTVFAL